MKTHICLSLLGALFTMTLSVALPAQAQQLSGVMMVVKGDIKVTTKEGKTEAGKVGRKVGSGDMITSGADSRAKIVMADKNVINVSPDSKIMIEKYENDGKDKKNVELNVLYGKVRASVEQKYDGEKSKFNIKTPSAVAGVRGTDFMAGYNPGTKVTQVITFSGTVAVGMPGPGGTIQNPVFVQPGQMTQAGAGQAPEAPKAMPAEDLNKLNNDSTADTAPAPAASTDKPEAKKEAAAEKEPAAEKQEPKKETAKESGDKKEPVASNQEPKKDAPAKDQAAAPAQDSGKPAASDQRGPASEGPSSGGSDKNSGKSPAPTSSPAAMAPPLPGAPGSAAPLISPVGTMLPRMPASIMPTTPSTFITETIGNKKVNVNITITRPAN